MPSTDVSEDPRESDHAAASGSQDPVQSNPSQSMHHDESKNHSVDETQPEDSQWPYATDSVSKQGPLPEQSMRFLALLGGNNIS